MKRVLKAIAFAIAVVVAGPLIALARLETLLFDEESRAGLRLVQGVPRADPDPCR